MDSIVLLSCVVASFFLSWLLFFVRTTRLERKIDELDRLLRLALKRTERGSDPGGFEEIRASVDHLGERLKETVETLQGNSAQSTTQKIHDMVERKLYNMGYESVRLSVGEDEAYSPDNPYRINLEVARRGVSYKGHALVRDGVVVDSRISPTYAVFP